MDLFRNKKNGTLYEVLYEGRDCTNSRDGTTVVIYKAFALALQEKYVRDKEEFYEKFELVH